MINQRKIHRHNQWHPSAIALKGLDASPRNSSVRNMNHRKLLLRNNKQRSQRRGAALVESAVVGSTLLLLILGMLDFGLAVLNRNNLEAAACRLARVAIVRGEHSEGEFTPWGPATYVGVASDGSEIAGEVFPYLAVMPANQVHIRLEWLDGSHAVDRRIRATLRYQHQPLLSGLFGTSTWQLQAVSVMRIQH